MIFRLCMLFWLIFACADEVARPQHTDSEDDNAVVFGHYELEEVATEPLGMPAQSDPATLRDVKFISKISATESLLVTEKNVTWRYNENDDTLTKITYDGDKSYDDRGWEQRTDKLGEGIEYGFSQHILRMYIHPNNTEAKMVVTPSIGGVGGGYSAPLLFKKDFYDAAKPPVMLYLDAETTAGKHPTILMFTHDKDKSDKGAYMVRSDKLRCEDSDPIQMKVNLSDKQHLSSTNRGAAGMASDGKSFWVLTNKSFGLILQGCKLKNNNDKRKDHAYEKFYFKELDNILSVSYRGESAHALPLGVWINVEDKAHPVIEGKIIAISADGKLLSAEQQ